VSVAHAVGAEPVADEPSEHLMLLLNLGDEALRNTLSTAGTAGSGLGSSDRGSDDMLAVQSTLIEVCALANTTVTAELYFVDAGTGGGRDEPNALLKRYLVAVVSVER
jgi:hypothetical protein